MNFSNNGRLSSMYGGLGLIFGFHQVRRADSTRHTQRVISGPVNIYQQQVDFGYNIIALSVNSSAEPIALQVHKTFCVALVWKTPAIVKNMDVWALMKSRSRYDIHVQVGANVTSLSHSVRATRFMLRQCRVSQGAVTCHTFLQQRKGIPKAWLSGSPDLYNDTVVTITDS